MLALPFVLIFDFLILNGTLALFRLWGWNIVPSHGVFICNLLYLISILCFPPVAQKRFSHIEEVARRSFTSSVFFFAILAIYIYIGTGTGVSPLKYIVLAAATTFLLFWGRVCARAIIKYVRHKGRNPRRVVFVGAGQNLAYLYNCMSSHMQEGFIFMGYFDNHISEHLPEKAKYLGNIEDIMPWLTHHQPQQLFCNLPSTRSKEILDIMNYCETHFIRFYSVPNVRNYVHRTMEVEMIDDMPVLSLLHDPLRYPHNKYIKRAIDLAISGLFLVTCFWWIYLIVAIITKITMPGPVFFCQKRNGIMGKEFNMLKFRSMKVNDQADTLQATKDDPRKTKWGNIMRKTNIDELPQFINVFLGDMSVVGPRPHMVKHTEEYSALIEKYMVRHWVKPGITGWAQVTGARGETEELWQMEERVQKDIWYIEHWSPWLDLRICLKTVWNVFAGDKQAY